MKKIQIEILNFVDKEGAEDEENFQNIIQQINEGNITSNRHEMKTLLYLLSNILNNHFRTPNFMTKIEKIILTYKKEIKEFYNSYEIFKIFRKNPKFLLFLINNEIIEVNKDILENMSEQTFIYLFPEKAKEKKLIEEIPSNFSNKQKIGENDDYISEIIRKDLIEEFITYVKQFDYYLESKIKESIFETNYFLMKHQNTTLIEYASFFGSTQIINYLSKNGVKLTSSLWIYGIHSDNPEMFQFLEENKISPPKDSYETCIKESIKCHHIDITNYIQSNYIDVNTDNNVVDYVNDKINDITKVLNPSNNNNRFDFLGSLSDFDSNFFEFDSTDEINSFHAIDNISDIGNPNNNNSNNYGFQYYNFQFIPQKMNYKLIFCNACKYDYFEFVEYFLKMIKIKLFNERILIKNKCLMIFLLFFVFL